MDFTVSNYDGIAVFQPVINGELLGGGGKFVILYKKIKHFF